MSWFEVAPRERILKWREWREHLKELPEHMLIRRVAESWAKTPLIAHYLAPDQPLQWPTPWELIQDNIYCDLAKVLGMYYSITLVNQSIPMNIEIYLDNDGWVNLVSIREKYVLNWHHGECVNIITSNIELGNLELKYSYNSHTIKIN